MTVHVRSGLIVNSADANGDVIAVRVEGLTPPHEHREAIHSPGWILHRLGNGNDRFCAHSVESERVCDGDQASSLWAQAAMRQLAAKVGVVPTSAAYQQ